MIAARVAERQKGLFKSYKRKYPHVPDYVMREVYNGTDRDNKSASKSLDGVMKEIGSREWKQETVDLHITKLSKLTKQNLLRRKFGLENPDNVPDDAERLERQIKSVGKDNEPIVVYDTGSALELVEGFHRTMARLVFGAGDVKKAFEEIAAAKTDLDLEHVAQKWKPVPTKAWVGRKKSGQPEAAEQEEDWSDFSF